MNSFLITRLNILLTPPLATIHKFFVRCFLTGGLAGLLFGCSVVNVDDHPVPASHRVQEAVDNVRTGLEKSLGIPVPSINVYVQTPTQTYFASSVPAGRQPLTPNTFFRFASLTKNFTASAIMKMHQDGWLDYKAVITDLIPGTNQPYVPATPDWNIPNKNRITIRQLLQHSAGVIDVDNDTIPELGDGYVNYQLMRDSTHQFTAEEMLKLIIDGKTRTPSYFDPGKDLYHYSNTGYFMLSRIIERVYSLKAGQAKTYADYLYDHITGPATKVPLPIRFPYQSSDVQLPEPNAASTTLWPLGRIDLFGRLNMSGHVGEGNGYSTMAALNTYVRSMMRGENALQPQIIKLMQTDVTKGKEGNNMGNEQYGLGTNFRQNLGYGHAGAIAGYLTHMAYDPATDVSIVAMLPLIDWRGGNASINACIGALVDAAYGARAALGYPGKP